VDILKKNGSSPHQVGNKSNNYHRGTENTEASTCFVVMIWTPLNVGAALAANNPSDRDEFAAEAAPAKLITL